MAEPDFINVAGSLNRFRGDNEIQAFEKINAWFIFLLEYIEAQTLTYATKSSAIDEGEMGQMSYDDDWLYICVETGIAGSAKWKKIAMPIAD